MRGRVATPVLTVSMPTWRTPQLRDAVDSVLNQTFRHLRLVVVADGDDSVWQLLDDITDLVYSIAGGSTTIDVGASFGLSAAGLNTIKLLGFDDLADSNFVTSP